MARWLLAGNRCSWRRFLVWTLTCFLILQLYSFAGRIRLQIEQIKLHSDLHPFPIQENEQIEGLILPPPFGLKDSLKVNLNEEFLNSSSKMRNIFFPRDTVDPRQDVNNDSRYYRPGRIWLDTNGTPIQAHGGGILFDRKSKMYFWYGECKDGPTYHARETGTARVDVIGVSCYSSKNLWAWKYEGVVLTAEGNTGSSDDLHKTSVLERPKVIYNEKTSKYVMLMHIDDATYNKASIGIAVSDSPTGPFRYIRSFRPNGFDSRDMTVFKDENGMAYLVYSSIRNKEIHISPLNRDYLDVFNETSRALVGHHREAPAVFKYNNIYYMVTSGCSGWSPNEALVHESESIFGPWETIGNPSVGANKGFRAATFFAQSTFVIPMPGGGPGWFILMADRWNPDDLRDSRYVWLPLSVKQRNERYLGRPLWSRVSVFWHKKWRSPVRELCCGLEE